MNKAIMRACGLGDHVDRVEKGLCPTCSKPIKQEDFVDDLCRKEFRISGLCQECQDRVFTPLHA